MTTVSECKLFLGQYMPRQTSHGNSHFCNRQLIKMAYSTKEISLHVLTCRDCWAPPQ